jgi:hypothetical protein
VADAARQLTREQQLGDAIELAQIPARDYRIYRALLKRARWKSAEILDQYQPRSLEELAALSKMSRSNVALGLNHLQRHGWLLRFRYIDGKGIGGRGHGTKYQPDLGRDCDCPKPSKGDRSKASKPRTVPEPKPSKNRALNRPEVADITAGQTPVPAKSVREEEEVEEGEQEASPVEWLSKNEVVYPASWKNWPAGSIGEEMNRP